MSLIRVSRPGYVTEFIDLGPSSGRAHTSRGGIRGWALAPTIAGSFVTEAPKPERTPAQREHDRELSRAWYATHKDEALEKQRRYRGRGRGISIHPENRR